MKKKTEIVCCEASPAESRARTLTERNGCCGARRKGVLARLKAVHSLPRSSSESEDSAPLLPHGSGKAKHAQPQVVLRHSRAKSEAHTVLCRISSLAGETARGQISAEFVITLVILFSLFSLVVFVSFQQKELTDFNSEKIKAKTLLEKTARVVNGIYLSGNGSTTVIEKQFDFELGFEENSVKVFFRQGQFVSASLIAKKIVFISKENATEISVKNLNGVIEVEEL